MFADINISQGSVARYARTGAIFDTQLTANLPRNLPLKNCKSVKIRQNFVNEFVASCTFLAQPVWISTLRHVVGFAVVASIGGVWCGTADMLSHSFARFSELSGESYTEVDAQCDKLVTAVDRGITEMKQPGTSCAISDQKAGLRCSHTKLTPWRRLAIPLVRFPLVFV